MCLCRTELRTRLLALWVLTQPLIIIYLVKANQWQIAGFPPTQEGTVLFSALLFSSILGPRQGGPRSDLLKSLSAANSPAGLFFRLSLCRGLLSSLAFLLLPLSPPSLPPSLSRPAALSCSSWLGNDAGCMEMWSVRLYNLGGAADVLCCTMMSELWAEAEAMLGRPACPQTVG